MSRARRLLVVAAVAAPLSQLGHALGAYLRYGRLLAPGGAHGYFAADLEASAALLGVALLTALAIVAGARRLSGRPLRGRGWPLGWIFLGLAGLQLEIYLVQELAEGATTMDVAVRGLAGQLPVAAVAALALRWLSVRLGPAVRRLRRPVTSVLVHLVPVPDAAPPALADVLVAAASRRRSPSRAPPTLLTARS
jgi:hypothetical protein